MIIRKLSAVFGFFCVFSAAQETQIDTVYIFDRQLKGAAKTQSVQRISAENFQRTSTNLSETLRFQTSVFIKENGRGMVSSPSFRGTTAQQTAFVWNGINVNSVFLGQGDINNLGLLGYDEIVVKPGGGSVRYGSGAIGGSIHLNNQLSFRKGFSSELFGEIASFGTINSSWKTAFSRDNLSVNISASHLESNNDYEVAEKLYKNTNGQYTNTVLSTGFGYRIGSSNKFFLQSQFFDGHQHFPIFSENQIRTKYATRSSRNIINWNYQQKSIENDLKIALLEENFNYFANKDQPKSSGGTANTFLIKEDFYYQIARNFSLNVLGEFQNIRGQGYRSGIHNAKRTVFSAAGLLSYQPTESVFFEAGVKKELIENYEAPLLLSFGTRWHPAEFYTLKLNTSRNFRAPSFNDLYWQPGGNLLLKPETSWQAELSQEIKFKNYRISATPFFIDIVDMIRWLPSEGGMWTPVNTNRVRSFGVEAAMGYNQKWQDHFVKFNIGYAYTHSQNLETKKQLQYVPFQKVFGTVEYGWRDFGIYFQGMYNGLTYTTSDESNENALQPYFVLNTGVFTTVFKHYKMGFKINNLTNQVYETTSFYPLPKRNFAFNFNINL